MSKVMQTDGARFVDPAKARRDQTAEQWPAILIPKEQIDAEVARLADLPAPENGRRESLIVHPRSTEPGLGLAPGIRVTLCVLKPGERTRPFRHNATEVNFCIRGGGTTLVGDRRVGFKQYEIGRAHV